MKKRLYGAGTIARSNGKWVARLPRAFDRKILGFFETKEEAQSVLDGAVSQLSEGLMDDNKGQPSLADIYAPFFRSREAVDNRSMERDKNRWGAYISTWRLYRRAIAAITSHDIREWRNALQTRKATRHRNKGQSLSVHTVKNAMSLLRAAFRFAVESRIIDNDPTANVRVTKKDLRTQEPWTYMTLEEQDRLINCATISMADRLLIQFAIGSGMRRGEIFALHWQDVFTGAKKHVVVRYGSPGKPPKNGKIRRIPLFGLALEAIKQWSNMQSNPKVGIVFPNENGGFRKEISHKLWGRYLEDAGIERHVRFHDLRHTCASSLATGWWGRRWSLEEVKNLLGHGTINLTERYAHLADTVVEQAASETLAPIGQSKAGNAEKTEEKGAFLNRWSQVQLLSGAPSKIDVFDLGTSDAFDQLLTNSKEYLLAVVNGSPNADELRCTLARDVLSIPFIQMALDAASGGPLAHARAIDLARKIIELSGSRSAARKSGGQ
jgi:integrase